MNEGSPDLITRKQNRWRQSMEAMAEITFPQKAGNAFGLKWVSKHMIDLTPEKSHG